MKRFSALFLAFAVLFAPAVILAANNDNDSNKPITITVPPNVLHFHPVYDGASANIRLFTSQTTAAGITFDVHPEKRYEVADFVNGVYTPVSLVYWTSDGQAHQEPLPAP